MKKEYKAPVMLVVNVKTESLLGSTTTPSSTSGWSS